MRISFDPKADAIRITFQEGKYAISKEVEDGVVLDMNEENEILAIEILDASERMPKKALTAITFGIAR